MNWIYGTDTTHITDIDTSTTSAFLGVSLNGYTINLPSTEFAGYSETALAWYSAIDEKPTGDTLGWFFEALDSTEYYAGDTLVFLHFHCMNTQDNSWINVVNPGTHDITDPGSTEPTWLRYNYSQGDGSTDYLSLNYSIGDSTIEGRFKLTIGSYILNNVQEEKVVMGFNSSYDVYIFPRNSADRISARINQSTDVLLSFHTDSRGYVAATRYANDDVRTFYNGNQVDAETDVSNGLQDLPLWLHAAYQSGSPAWESTYQVMADFGGGALSPYGHGKLNEILERLANHLGLYVIP
jgi:hypothetical protein